MRKSIAVLLFAVVLAAGAASAGIPNVDDYVVYYGAGQINNLKTFDVAIIESNQYTSANITQIESNGTRTICYVSIGEDPVLHVGDGQGPGGYASWYFDANGDNQPDQNPNFGAYYANASNQGWQDWILNNITPPIANKGCDGFFLDTLETADIYTGTRSGMIDLISDLDSAYSSLYLVTNRGFTMANSFAPYIDGFMFESFTSHYNWVNNNYIFWQGADFQWTTDRANELVGLRNTYGFTVFALDYSFPTNTTMIREDYNRAFMFDFKYYASTVALDQVFMHTVAPRCVVKGEGAQISKNSNFSTNDTSFSTSDRIYMRIWSNQIDTKGAQLTAKTYVLKKGTQTIKSGTLTTTNNCTYTTDYKFISSSTGNWTANMTLKDMNNDKHNATIPFCVGINCSVSGGGGGGNGTGNGTNGYTLLGTDAAGDVAIADIDLLNLSAKTVNSSLAYYKMKVAGTIGSYFYQVYLDSDENAGTGYSVSGIGADYFIENGNLYQHGGGGWNWTFVKAITSNTAGSEREYIAQLSDIGESEGSGTKVLFVAGNGAGTEDYSSVFNYTYNSSSGNGSSGGGNGSSSYTLLGTDPSGDVSLSALDMLNLYAKTVNSSLAYYKMNIAGAYSGSYFYEIFLDTDQNSGTGYSISGIGADYFIENSNLYQHAGGGWNWNWVKAVTMNTNGTDREWGVALSDIGESIGSNSTLVFVASNGAGTEDYSSVFSFRY